MPHADHLRCAHLFAPTGPRCELAGGHLGQHSAHVIWGDAFADADTISMPPIRETVLRRPPAPTVRELVDRAELLEAMQAELRAELRELLDADRSRGLEGRDDDDQDLGPKMCSAVRDRGDGVEFVCVFSHGHNGPHRGADGRTWTA